MVAKRLKFDQRLHEAGERCPVEDKSVSRALAWWIAAELVRRHPGRLQIIETHPMDGHYDCISVFDQGVEGAGDPGIVLHMNVDPGTHITHRSWFSDESEDETRFNWLEVLLCGDRRRYVVKQLERVEGLPSPSRTPSTRPESIGPLVIAAFLQRSLLGPAKWQALNGVEDPAYGDNIRSELFSAIPGARIASDCGIDGVDHLQPEYRFWFLAEENRDGSTDAPTVAIDTWAGLLWRADGPEVDLMSVYSDESRSLDRVVSATCPPAF